MNLDPAPRLNKLPFFLTAAGCFTVVLLIGLFAEDRFAPITFLPAVGFLILSITAVMIPFITDYAADQAESTQVIRDQLEAQNTRLHAAAESLARAAAQLKAVEEAAHKSARDAETLPYRMQEKLAEFNEALAQREEEQRDALEQELAELRAAHSAHLKAAAEKIQKTVAELHTVEKEARAQLADASAALAKFQGGAGEAATRAADAITRAADAAEQRIAAALARLDARIAELPQALAAVSPAARPATAEAAPAPFPTTPDTIAPPSEEESRPPFAFFASNPPMPAATGSSPSEPAPAPDPSPEPPPAPAEPPAEPAAPPPLPAAPPKLKKPRAPKKPKPEEPAPAESAAEPAAAPEPPPPPAPVIPLGAEDEPPDEPPPKPESSASSDGATRLLATAYIGIGNKLFIRGDGPGLSWDVGVPMQFVSIGKWGWFTHEASGPIRCKLLKNDEHPALSGEILLEPGKHTEATALF